MLKIEIYNIIITRGQYFDTSARVGLSVSLRFFRYIIT